MRTKPPNYFDWIETEAEAGRKAESLETRLRYAPHQTQETSGMIPSQYDILTHTQIEQTGLDDRWGLKAAFYWQFKARKSRQPPRAKLLSVVVLSAWSRGEYHDRNVPSVTTRSLEQLDELAPYAEEWAKTNPAASRAAIEVARMNGLIQ